MAARAASNIQYIPQVSLDARYGPIIKRDSKQVELPMRSSFLTQRCFGDTNIDMWINGDIYLVDLITWKPNRLKTLKEFIEFLCHGKQGLQGYTYRLMYHCLYGPTLHEEDMEMQCRHLSEEVLLLRDEAIASNSRMAQDFQMERMRCVELEKTYTDLQAELQTVYDSHAQKVEQLECHVQSLQDDVERC